jgi:hypothetical protein
MNERIIKPVTNSLKNPDYTGENRCYPCTVLNIIIAIIISGSFAYVSSPLAIGVLFISFLTIYLHGYLIPGTPIITEKYFPQWLLSFFDKQSTLHVTSPENDTVPLLFERDIIITTEEDELFLGDDFTCAIESELEAAKEHGYGREDVASILGIDSAGISFKDFDNAFLMTNDDSIIGKWESSAAVLLDIAAGRAMQSLIPEWNLLSSQDRRHLLRSIRSVAGTCPACGEPVKRSETVVESCCSSTDSIAVDCTGCEKRLLEVPA